VMASPQAVRVTADVRVRVADARTCMRPAAHLVHTDTVTDALNRMEERCSTASA
jgi:hypothetical protein